MRDSRKRHTRAELLLRAGGIIAGAILMLLMAGGSALAAWHMYERLEMATDAADSAKSQLALLSAQSDKVSGDIANLSTSRGVEAALRERYGVVKPGEGVIEVVDAPPASSTGEEGASGGFFARLFHTLFPW